MISTFILSSCVSYLSFLNGSLGHTNIVLKTIHFAFGCKPSVSGSLLNDLKLNELFLNSSLRHGFNSMSISSLQHFCQ